MLDLQSWVELQEVEGARLLDEEVLDGTRVRVVDHERELGRRELHLFHRVGADRNRRALLNDLLEAPLHRAVAAREDRDILVLVGKDMDLDVPRAVA